MRRTPIETEKTPLLRGAAVIFAAAVTLIAGCGSADEPSDRRQIADAISELQQAVGRGDVAGACAILGTRPRRQIGSVGHGRRPTTCERDLRAFVDGIGAAAAVAGEPRPDLRRLELPRLRSVTIAGDRAIAHTTLRSGPLDVPFRQEDGEWRLDDFFVVTGPVREDLQ